MSVWKFGSALVAAGLVIASPLSAEPVDPMAETVVAAVRAIVDNFDGPTESKAVIRNGLAGLGAPKRKEAQKLDAALGLPAESEVLIEAIRQRPRAARQAALAAALQGMAGGLDRASRFVPQKEFAPPEASIGVELAQRDGVTLVVRPVPGAPAEGAGLRPGDMIKSIDGKLLDGRRLADVMRMLMGAEGTPVTLRVDREMSPGAITVDVYRAPIEPPPPPAALVGKVALVQLARLHSRSAEQVRTSIDLARQRVGEVDGVVLDLRGNAGGLLDVSAALAGLFLPEGKPVASLKGRGAKDNRTFTAAGGDISGGAPLVVIVDRTTAAGGEILAWALKDAGRAVVIGEKTAGAGSIQTVLPLPHQTGALYLTTARAFRATGAPLEGTGVEPDVALDFTARIATVSGWLDAARREEAAKTLATPRDPPDPAIDFGTWTAIRAVELLRGPAKP